MPLGKKNKSKKSKKLNRKRNSKKNLRKSRKNKSRKIKLKRKTKRGRNILQSSDFKNTLRIHVSRKPIKVSDLHENTRELKIGYKPYGFWYSCEFEWYDWTKDEEFYEYEENEDGVKKDLKIYNVILNPENLKIYKINNIESINKFNEKYIIKKGNVGLEYYQINWPQVKRDGYDGIEFCPNVRGYINDNDLFGNPKFIWAATLDVASGCIWNTKAIKELVLINKKKLNLDNEGNRDFLLKNPLYRVEES